MTRPAGRPELSAEIVVVGAGPAGALAARQLARLGVEVVLVHRARRQQRAESLGASAPRLLGSYGLELPESVFSPRPCDHFVFWGGREDRVAAQPEDSGRFGEGQRLVWRGALDEWALAEAKRAGAGVVEGSAAVDDAAGPGAGVRVRESRGRTLRIEARAVVDASGRSGTLTGSKRVRPEFRTTALTAHFAGSEARGTSVVSFADGWIWSAPLPHGRRDVTALVDAEAAAGNAEDCFRAAVASAAHGTPAAGRFLSGSQVTPIRAADATPYVSGADPPAGAITLAVGDASSALDPLTGLGVMKAMDSGLTGAVVLRTALARPEHAALALAFHADKERGLAAESAERIAGFYAEERRFADRPFWRRRAGTPPAPSPPPPPPSPATRLYPAEGARIETRGVLDGDWIVPAEVLARPGRPRPAHRVEGASLAPLFRRAEGGVTAAELARPVPGARASGMRAVGWLVREGFLAPGPGGQPDRRD